MMLLAPIPWAQRTWALPVLTVLAPSEQYHQNHHKRHKPLSDWARQMGRQVWRWLPEGSIILVGDGSCAVIELLWVLTQMNRPIHIITRLRLDAQLYQPAPPRRPKQMGRPRKVGARLPNLKTLIDHPLVPWQTIVMKDWYGQGNYQLNITSSTAVWYKTGQPAVPIRWVLIQDPKGKFKTQALLCTDLVVSPTQILQWFRHRWQVEVTFEEVRVHLGVESQRQWSPLAIVRTTPALLGLFSIVVALAHQWQSIHGFDLPKAAWYHKKVPTFAQESPYLC